MTAKAESRPLLVCPAGTPAALRTAVEAGADAVYCGFQGPTNVRNFPGLNFTPEEMERGIAFAHERGAKVYVAVNTFPAAGNMDHWKEAAGNAVRFGADAVIVADLGVASYVSRTFPEQRLHLSVQGCAASPEAIRYYCEAFGIKCVVLPRLLTVAEISDVKNAVPCEVETFIFGNVGIMAEGRCVLSSYATGISTNMDGVCSPPEHIHYETGSDGSLKTRIGEFAIDCFGCGESAGYPTVCKGRYDADVRQGFHTFEEHRSLNLTPILGDLIKAGVYAFKIEGRQRSRAYVREVVSSFRRAVDACLDGRDPDVADLLALMEGGKETRGAFGGKAWR